MSRIGKKIIVLPSNVELKYDEQTRLISVKGPLGELVRTISDCVLISNENGNITIAVKDENDRKQKAIWGTSRAVINNMIVGVSTGFNKTVELNGVGFRMELTPTVLTLYIGFSHPVLVEIPPLVKLTLTKNVLSGTSIDKELIGDFFSSVHNRKICDPYKQKGFKFPGRFYRKKVVKKGK